MSIPLYTQGVCVFLSGRRRSGADQVDLSSRMFNSFLDFFCETFALEIFGKFIFNKYYFFIK